MIDQINQPNSGRGVRRCRRVLGLRRQTYYARNAPRPRTTNSPRCCTGRARRTRTGGSGRSSASCAVHPSTASTTSGCIGSGSARACTCVAPRSANGSTARTASCWLPGGGQRGVGDGLRQRLGRRPEPAGGPRDQRHGRGLAAGAVDRGRREHLDANPDRGPRPRRRGARSPGLRPLRQRSGVRQRPTTQPGEGKRGRAPLHPTRQADAERSDRALKQDLTRRMPRVELVYDLRRAQRRDPSLVADLQPAT